MTDRTPTAHRAITAEQADNQPRGNIRTYRSNRWPQAERLHGDVGGRFMVSALIGWRDFNAVPTMCVANDNYEGEERNVEAGDTVREQPNTDLRMDTITGDRVVALHAKGKSWRPDEERFDRPRRNDPERAPAAGIYTINGAAYYQAEAGAEDEAIRAIDCTSARLRLGHVCCRLLDLASGDATTDEISFAVKQPYDPRTPTWVDWAIVRWMRDDAYKQYVVAA